MAPYLSSIDYELYILYFKFDVVEMSKPCSLSDAEYFFKCEWNI